MRQRGLVRSVTVTVLLAMTLLSGLHATSSVDATEEWLVVNIDEGDGSLAGTEVSTSITLDSRGWIHICYGTDFIVWSDSIGTKTCDVRLANNVDGTWNISQIDTSNWFGYVTGSTDIVVDSSDRIHLSYVVPEGVNYSVVESGVVMSDQIPDSGLNDAGGEAVLGIYSDGCPHIFFGGVGLGIRQAMLVSGDWQILAIADAYDVGSMDAAFDQSDNYYLTCAQVDALGSPFQVSYYSAECSTSFGEGWQSAIAVDALGDVHLVYCENGNAAESGQLVYVFIENGILPHQPQVVGKGDFYDPSLEVDGEGRVHLVYSLLTDVSDTLVYSVKEGSAWKSATIVQVQSETTWVFIQSPSLALDENGTPHVGYWVGGAPEGVEGGLYLAVLQPSSPGPGFPTTTAFAVALLCAGVAAIVLWRRGMRVRAEEP